MAAEAESALFTWWEEACLGTFSERHVLCIVYVIQCRLDFELKQQISVSFRPAQAVLMTMPEQWYVVCFCSQQ